MYKLYNVKTWGSISIHCLLEEMELPYTNIWMTAEQVRDPKFRELSPLGTVPALGLDDGRTLYESAAIVSFLIAAHPDKAMAPELGSPAYGEFMSVLHFMSTELYPTSILVYSDMGYGRTKADNEYIAAKATEKADAYWQFLDRRLTKNPWLMGRDFSALDLYAFMLSLWAKPGERALHRKFPHIARLATAVRGRPKLKAVLESHGVLEPAGAAA